MNKPRKTRTDSTDNLTRIFASADTELAPPDHVRMTDESWPFWHSLVAEFAAADWTAHTLEIAALLARTMAELEIEQRVQRAEGFVVKRPNGDTVFNPRNRVVSSLMGQVLAMRRSLALHARGKSGSNSDAAKQREANRNAERSLRSGSPRPDLLA